MIRSILAMVGAAFLSVAPAVADDTASEVASGVERVAGPLPRFFPHLESYLDIPEAERSHFRMAYVVSSADGIPPEDIRMWYEHDGETRQFALDATGRITRLPGLTALDAEPDVWINQPAGGGFSLSMQFEYSGPGASEFSRDALAISVEQANRAIRSAAGVAALFAPRMESVVFVFEGAAPEAWAIDRNGERSPLTVQENRAFFRPADRRSRSVERIEFGREPVRILLDS
jgi:hypothetical protein